MTGELSELCGAVLDRGPAERPRRVTCVKPIGHDGRHFATWGGSQKWRQQEWSDVPARAGTAPPDYEEAVAWTLGRLLDFMDATRRLFEGASSDDGWDAAVSRLQVLYNTTLDALMPVAERLRP